MTVRFISDLHFDHNNIAKYEGVNRGGVKNVAEHNEWIISQFNSVVNKNDLTWILGDVSFTREGLGLVRRLNGVKHLILGNHDTHAFKHYAEVFNKIHGFLKYKGVWLSHAPIRDLRDKINIHGHTHGKSIINLQWPNHRCVCVEALQGKPAELEYLIGGV